MNNWRFRPPSLGVKRARSLASALLILIPLAIGSTFSSFPVTRVSFPNGGFESHPGGGPDDWQWPDSDWVWDGSIAHNGAHSARVSRSSGSSTDNLWSARVTVQPSTVYTVSFWLRTQNATWYPRVIIRQYTDMGAQTGPNLIAYTNIKDGINDWMLTTYRFQTLPDADTVRVQIYLSIDTTGTFWFDDFALDEEARAVFPFQNGFPVNTFSFGWIYFSSPTVADVDNDGDNELLVAAGNVVNGWDETGAELPGFPLVTGDSRIVAQLALGDLDNNGDLEIVAGTRTPVSDGRGRIFVWDHNGVLVSGWPQSVAWDTRCAGGVSVVSSIALADIDGDDDLEILAGTANNANECLGDSPPAVPNAYAWHADGSLVAGDWPNWHTIAGIYGAIGAGDLSGDGVADVIVARDHHYLNAYTSDGSSLPGWPIQTFLEGNEGDYHTDQRVVHAHSAPILADLEGDGVAEYIVAGNVAGPGNDTTVLNSGVLVMEPDGTRQPGWGAAALGNGILTHDTPPQQAPAVADLDEDGQLEIIVATHDGWIRAYEHDKTVLWAVDYTRDAVLFASEPVVGDIDGDGALEIVFGTYVPTPNDRDGPVGVWGLEADGTIMSGFPLPVSPPGVQAAPTLADLDGDGDLEILVGTRTGQVFVWDTPTPYDPGWLPWPMGRHDLRRSATYVRPRPDFSSSRKFATPIVARQEERVKYTIQVVSSIPTDELIRVTDTIPTGLSYVPGSLTATSGMATETGGVLKWSGVLSDTLSADITYQVTVTTAATRLIRNTVLIDTAINELVTCTGNLFANGYWFFLPTVFKPCCF